METQRDEFPYPYRDSVLAIFSFVAGTSVHRWRAPIALPIAVLGIAGVKLLPATIIERILFPKKRRSAWTKEFSKKVGGRIHLTTF